MRRRDPVERCAIRGLVAACILFSAGLTGSAQQEETTQQELHRLTQALDQAQAQAAASQEQLRVVRRELAALEQRLAHDSIASSAALSSSSVGGAAAASPAAANDDDDLSARQAMQASQIATLDQSKVGSGSKYPVTVSGMILFNTFVNTSEVDSAPLPVTAIPGSGSTGASLRQTSLGINARGPQLAGATSYADLHVDFLGNATQTTDANVIGLLRLRTAHASLDWADTRATVEFDRPIISPNVPTSLVAVSQPALAWSGNLWTWTPQAVVSHAVRFGRSTRLSAEAAFIDVPDPPALQTSSTATVSQGERSRWPGSELHVELSSRRDGAGRGIGFGGYFSPHATPGGVRYNAWAGTADFRTPLPLGLQLSGSFYRGLALGGLGGGAYKDTVYRVEGTRLRTRPLDDVGGWAQVKRPVSQRLEFNGAFGMDNGFAKELRRYPDNASIVYQGLARNRTFFANAIYSPSAYLLFSLEYRHIATSPITGATAISNVIGVAAGYKF